jgi:hypothetical protein
MANGSATSVYGRTTNRGDSEMPQPRCLMSCGNGGSWLGSYCGTVWSMPLYGAWLLPPGVVVLRSSDPSTGESRMTATSLV